jgi:hypothetical protein
MAHFSLNFVCDDDEEASLFVSLDTGDFKGQGHYWCPPREFENLRAALRTYPIPKERPLAMLWYGGCIELHVEPIDSIGHLAVSVAVREFSSDWNRCQSRFHTTYGELDRFREQLDRAIDEGCGEAVLAARSD